MLTVTVPRKLEFHLVARHPKQLGKPPPDAFDNKAVAQHGGFGSTQAATCAGRLRRSPSPCLAQEIFAFSVRKDPLYGSDIRLGMKSAQSWTHNRSVPGDTGLHFCCADVWALCCRAVRRLPARGRLGAPLRHMLCLAPCGAQVRESSARTTRPHQRQPGASVSTRADPGEDDRGLETRRSAQNDSR